VVRIVGKKLILDGYCARRAEAGAPGVEQMLTMTPCDMFELLEGRTLWLVGDSLTQVSIMMCPEFDLRCHPSGIRI
jgi:hypothetical protein